MGAEISGSRNVSADERVAWELTAAPVPVGIGRTTYVYVINQAPECIYTIR